MPAKPNKQAVRSAQGKRKPAPPAAKPAKSAPSKRKSARPAARTTEAVAEAAGEAAGAYLRDQRAAFAEAAAVAQPPAQRRGAGDPLTGELRSRLLPLLVLHFMSQGPSYGNQLIDRVTELTGGVLTVNPNTMYPLLRGFEARGLIEGQWEHPERRSRRFYSLTPEGQNELKRLLPGARESLDSLGRTLNDIRNELFE